MVLTKSDFARILDEAGFPQEFQVGGRSVKYNSTYGNWLKRSNPNKFNELYEDYLIKNNLERWYPHGSNSRYR